MDLGLSNFNKAQTVINRAGGLIEENWATEMGCNRTGSKYTRGELHGPQSKNQFNGQLYSPQNGP